MKHQFNQLALGPQSGTRICPPIAAFPFVFTEKDYDALSSVIYNLYGRDYKMTSLCIRSIKRKNAQNINFDLLTLIYAKWKHFVDELYYCIKLVIYSIKLSYLNFRTYCYHILILPRILRHRVCVFIQTVSETVWKMNH